MKCPHCGFVAFATEEICKKCKQNMFEPLAEPGFGAYDNPPASSFAGSPTAGAYAASGAGVNPGAYTTTSNASPYVSPYEQPDKSISWGSVGFGLLMIGVAFFLYYTFDNLEKEGGSVRMNAIVILLYNIGGKWLASIVVALIGIGTMIAGFNGTSAGEE